MAAEDFWDQHDAFQLRVEEECSKKVKEGKLGEFEREWQDPLQKLLKQDWFMIATPGARKAALNNLRRDIGKMIRNYRLDEKALGSYHRMCRAVPTTVK